jgi:tRNA G18 (ribose-2'-O)-methylase SpoU
VIENLPGAGGISGTQAIVSSRPDGQTIGVVSNNHVINPSVYSKMPFDSIAEARLHGCRVIATVPRGGRPLHEIDLRGPIAILIGGEGQGLTAAVVDAADERVSIPMQAPVESLNAAVTAGLIVYEARRQRAATKTRTHEA